jgi:hypothetical protein
VDSQTCSDDIVFHVAELDLGGASFSTLELKFRDAAHPDDSNPLRALEGETFTTRSRWPDLLSVSAVVNGNEAIDTTTLPIAITTVGDFEARIITGGVCDRAEVTPSDTFEYQAGRSAAYNGAAGAWSTRELLVATARVTTATGAAITITENLPVKPRAEEPCEIRSFGGGDDVLVNYTRTATQWIDDDPRIELDRVYFTDACNNVVNGVGEGDLSVTAPLQPVAPAKGVWATAVPDGNDWSYSVILHSNAQFVEDPEGPPCWCEEGCVPEGDHEVFLEAASSSPECSSGGVIAGSVTAQTDSQRPHVILLWDQNPPDRGPDPKDSVVSPGGSIRDSVTGEVAVWRVPAATNTDYYYFLGVDPPVPVRLYVARIDGIPFDVNGNIDESYLEPVEGVELCTGVVEKQLNGLGTIDPHFTPAVRVSCDTTWATVAEGPSVVASSDPLEQEGDVIGVEGEWVEDGLGVGILRAPSEPGEYALIVEPMDESFRGGDAWRTDSHLFRDGMKRFVVGGAQILTTTYQPIHQPWFLAKPTTVVVASSLEETSPQVSLPIRYSNDLGTLSEVTINVNRVARPAKSVGLYYGELNLVGGSSKQTTGGNLQITSGGSIEVFDPAGVLKMTEEPVEYARVVGIAPQSEDFASPEVSGRIMISTTHDNLYYTRSSASPDRDPAQTEDKEVVISAYVLPPKPGIEVFFEIMDPDDPSDDGTTSGIREPIGDPSNPIGINNINLLDDVDDEPNDNRDPQRTMFPGSQSAYNQYQDSCLSSRIAVTTEITSLNGVDVAVAETTLEITDSYSGDNYQVRATAVDPRDVGLCDAHDLTCLDGWRPFNSESGVEGCSPESGCSLDLDDTTVKATAILTAWKRFYYEVDRMFKVSAFIHNSGSYLTSDPTVVRVDNAQELDLDIGDEIWIRERSDTFGEDSDILGEKCVIASIEADHLVVSPPLVGWYRESAGAHIGKWTDADDPDFDPVFSLNSAELSIPWELSYTELVYRPAGSAIVPFSRFSLPNETSISDEYYQNYFIPYDEVFDEDGVFQGISVPTDPIQYIYDNYFYIIVGDRAFDCEDDDGNPIECSYSGHSLYSLNSWSPDVHWVFAGRVQYVCGAIGNVCVWDFGQATAAHELLHRIDVRAGLYYTGDPLKGGHHPADERQPGTYWYPSTPGNPPVASPFAPSCVMNTLGTTFESGLPNWCNQHYYMVRDRW